MKRLLLAAAVAALLPGVALAQSYTYSPGQSGAVGPIIGSTDTQGNERGIVLPTVQIARGVTSRLDITGSTLVASGPHRVATFCVVTAGSTAGTLNDAASTGGAAIANEVAPILNALGCTLIDWPVTNGLVIVPGTGQVVTVVYF